MKRWHWLAVLVLSLASLAAEFSIGQHGDHWWSSIPAFYIIFGFIGCLAIIFVSKFLGKLFLQQKENYYNDR